MVVLLHTSRTLARFTRHSWADPEILLSYRQHPHFVIVLHLTWSCMIQWHQYEHYFRLSSSPLWILHNTCCTVTHVEKSINKWKLWLRFLCSCLCRGGTGIGGGSGISGGRRNGCGLLMGWGWGETVFRREAPQLSTSHCTWLHKKKWICTWKYFWTIKTRIRIVVEGSATKSLLTKFSMSWKTYE